MTQGFLDHKYLQIIKGFGKTPTDNNSNEIDPVVVDLMSGLITLDPKGWTPEIPQIKNGGVWADSPISDGRQLLAAANGNVTETITVNISDSSYLTTIKALSGLDKMAQDCADFWQTQAQYNPVFLAWWAGCGAGMQYALIYNMQLAPTYIDGDRPTIQVVISVEREPYWRAIPPGANPRLWTLYKAGKLPTTANAHLLTQTDDLIYDTNTKNRFEWNTTVNGATSRNYVDIPAALIDGDAPALVELMIQATTDATNPTSSIFVGRSTRPTSIQDRNGNVTLQSLVFNAGDAVAPVNWTKTADATCGCLSVTSAVTKFIGRNAALPNGTYTSFAVWKFFTSQNFVSASLMSGRFVAFLRCKQLTGVDGDLRVRIRVNDNQSTYLGDYQNLPLVAAAGATCENRFDLLYLATFTLPLGNNISSSADGRGISTPQKNLTVPSAQLALDVINGAGANRSIDFLDLVLIPIGESVANLLMSPNPGGAFVYFAYDNTGYLNHGDPKQTAKFVTWDSSITTVESALEARGSDLTLVPKVNNRLYFIYQRAPFAGGVNFSAPDSSNDWASIRVNIIPRWVGIRDV